MELRRLQGTVKENASQELLVQLLNAAELATRENDNILMIAD